uniref:Aquaporin-8 n=1 Tax=Lygus hesperus TaxID=30085 RepID=A0A0A9WLS5_LYGHE
MPSNTYASFTKRRLFYYVTAQMLGGVTATFFCMMISGRVFSVPNMGLDFVHMLRGFFAESAYTFLICSAMLHVSISKQRNSNFSAFSVGFAVICGGLTSGPISGGVFNPAIATPLIVLRCLFSFDNAGCMPMASLWVY